MLERRDRLSALRIGWVCFVSYMSCYFGKNLLSAMMPQLLESGMLDDAALGQMASIFMLTYGMGQLVNGAIGNRVRGRYMITLGLFCAGVLLIAFPHTQSPLFGILSWGACGFFCSMLWGPISRMIGENTHPVAGQLLVTLMTVASTVGSLATQALAVVCGILDEASFAFYACGGFLCFISLLAFFYLWHLERCGVVRVGLLTEERAGKRSGGWGFVTPCFICMMLATMLNGIVRNAVSFWIPTFLAQYLGYSSELAAGLVMALPFFNILGMFLTLGVLHRTKRDEKLVCFGCFLVCVPLFLGLYVFRGALALCSVIALFLASGVMMGACNLVFSVYVLRFHKTGKLSGISGFFDFSSYLSASAASLFFAELMTGGNWNGLILCWTLIAALGAGFSALAGIFGKRRADGI